MWILHALWLRKYCQPEKGEPFVYTLADIKIRSDASYAKDYLNGKYGAIPVVELGANEVNGAFGG